MSMLEHPLFGQSGIDQIAVALKLPAGDIEALDILFTTGQSGRIRVWDSQQNLQIFVAEREGINALRNVLKLPSWGQSIMIRIVRRDYLYIDYRFSPDPASAQSLLDYLESVSFTLVESPEYVHA